MGGVNALDTFMKTAPDGRFLYREKCLVTGSQIVAADCPPSFRKTMMLVIKFVNRLNYNHFSQFSDMSLENMSYSTYISLKPANYIH